MFMLGHLKHSFWTNRTLSSLLGYDFPLAHQECVGWAKAGVWGEGRGTWKRRNIFGVSSFKPVDLYFLPRAADTSVSRLTVRWLCGCLRGLVGAVGVFIAQ